ncbi:hypothetical protein [Bacillus cereus]|uniref:hypothetical protein n=1 Tax=Bacillus cereus TaxID=1396 RepID=UPI000BECCF6A|nr:hypothetical protein [Bacillus cereus]PEF63698.1 hypothetical protein CON35_17450 [Bacillus cereus]
MSQIKEYDLAYICYYAEKIELSAIAAGFAPSLSIKALESLIQELKETNQFDFYKKMYQDLLE